MSRSKRPRRPELAGILNIDKPPGLTSHDVVAAIRRAAHIRRVGHTGTLDPLATGVLLICLDQATRVARYLAATDKVYRAQIRLGQATDTDDAAGQIIHQHSLPAALDAAALESALASFVGEIDQLPPRYAAIKQHGQPLYALARQGLDPQPAPRRIVIHTIQLDEWRSPDLTVQVHCGPGTYIRALARDLGDRLGCGGHLIALARLRSGSFSLAQAASLEEAVHRLEGAARREDVADILWPLDAALASMARLTVDKETERRLRHGQQISAEPPDCADESPAWRRVYAADGTLVAIVQYDVRTGLWQPDTVFDLGPPSTP